MDIRCHAWKFNGRHYISVQAGWRFTRLRIPSGGATVADAPCRGLAVKQRERLFFRVKLLEGAWTFRVFLDASVFNGRFKIGLVQDAFAWLPASGYLR